MTNAGLNFLKSVEQKLPGKRAQKKAFLKTLAANVAERLEEEPALDVASLVEAFGSPEKLAAEFAETLDAKEIKKAFGWKKIVLIGVIAFLLIWLIGVIIAVVDGHNAANGYDVVYYESDDSTYISEGNNK